MDKTKAMIFSKKSSVEDFYGFYYMHNIVPIVDQYKYLGLVFTSNGNLLFASEQLSERAKKAYYALKSSIPGNNNLSVQILLKLYQSMITKNQEVSCFGQSGEGDDSKAFIILDDNWVLKCLNKKEG